MRHRVMSEWPGRMERSESKGATRRGRKAATFGLREERDLHVVPSLHQASKMRRHLHCKIAKLGSFITLSGRDIRPTPDPEVPGRSRCYEMWSTQPSQKHLSLRCGGLRSTRGPEVAHPRDRRRAGESVLRGISGTAVNPETSTGRLLCARKGSGHCQSTQAHQSKYVVVST